MEKTKILANQSIYELVKRYPKILDIMVEIGFKDIVKNGMLQSVGKYMTLEKGAKIRRISWGTIVETFDTHGFIIIKEDER